MSAPALSHASAVRVKEAVSLHAVAQSYGINLRPSGTDCETALCVFHQEKSPSFTLHPKAGYFHCFGCGAGGDVITFVERIESLHFAEAVRLLADRYGVSLDDQPQTKAQRITARRQREYAEATAAEAAIWWSWVLARWETRFRVLLGAAVILSDSGDEDGYQRLARRAWRWGAGIRRMVAREPAWLMREYQRVSRRADVVRVVAGARWEAWVWDQVRAGLRAGRVDLDGVVARLAAAVVEAPH